MQWENGTFNGESCALGGETKERLFERIERDLHEIYIRCTWVDKWNVVEMDR